MPLPGCTHTSSEPRTECSNRWNFGDPSLLQLPLRHSKPFEAIRTNGKMPNGWISWVYHRWHSAAHRWSHQKSPHLGSTIHPTLILRLYRSSVRANGTESGWRKHIASIKLHLLNAIYNVNFACLRKVTLLRSRIAQLATTVLPNHSSKMIFVMKLFNEMLFDRKHFDGMLLDGKLFSEKHFDRSSSWSVFGCLVVRSTVGFWQ